jgi:hypothetical protein
MTSSYRIMAFGLKIGQEVEYEKRLKLQLLQAELIVLKQNAQSAILTGSASEEKYSLVTFDLQVIESILVDTYTITVSDSQLIEALAQIRQVARVANNKIQIFFSIVAFPMSHHVQLVKEHNVFMEAKCTKLVSFCESAITRLGIMLGS